MNFVQPWSLSGAVHSIASGEVTPSELVRRSFERIAAVESEVEAWVRLDESAAQATADWLDTRPSQGLLHGIPIGVKDIIDVAALPTECGAASRIGNVATKDAWFVARLRQAGAVIVGKTVTTEYAYFAPGPTRNPHDRGHTPGGSSSGSAAAVSAGMVPLALGSQTAASLTRPAAYCGVAGFVAPAGSLSTEGVVGLSPSLDSLGLLTPTVQDLAIARAALAGCSRIPILADVVSPRLLIWDGTEIADVDTDMLDGLEAAAKVLDRSGASITQLTWEGSCGKLTESHMTVMAFESVRELAEEAKNPERLSQPLATLLAEGAQITPRAHQSALAYARGQRSALLTMLQDYDAVLAPAASGPAPLGLAATGSPILSRPWQLLGLPVVTIPGLQDRHAMPLGLQLIGRPDSEKQLLELAHWVEGQLHNLQL